MTISIELPAGTEKALREQADKNGISASEYARVLLERVLPGAVGEDEEQGETLDVALAGLIGVVNSGGADRLSENCGEKFTAYLEQKRGEYHL